MNPLQTVFAWSAKRTSSSLRRSSQISITRRCLGTTVLKDIYDVVVLGGGPAGLSVTAALRSSNVTSDLKIALVEDSDLGALRNWRPSPDSYSNRVSSLTTSSIEFLGDIGATKQLERDRIQAYNGMKVWDGVSDSQISFRWPESENTYNGTIAYMVENVNLTAALIRRIGEIGGTEIVDKSRVERIAVGGGQEGKESVIGGWPVLELKGGRRLCARLLVGADGGNSPARRFADIESRGWDYDKHGVVATLNLDRSKESFGEVNAYQRFLPTGPVAMLPLPGNYVTLVWSTDTKIAAHLKSLSSADFIAMVNASFRLSYVDLNYLYTIKDGIEDQVNWRVSVTSFDESRVPAKAIHVQENSVASFPLKYRHADSYIAERIALVGDAAHTIHPLAGQGLNQGIGDAQSLIKAIEFAVQHGQDIGSILSLESYASDRYFKNHLVLGVVDKLHKLYGTSFAPVVGIRSLGLNAVNAFQPLKTFFMKQASGI